MAHEVPNHPVRPDPAPSGPWGPHQHGTGGAPRLESVAIRDILGILRRRIWLILGVATLLTLTVVLKLSRQQHVFRATAVVLLADVRQSVTGGIAGEVNERPVGRFTDPILSQIEVLRGRTVVGRVVDREGLRLVAGSGTSILHLLTDVYVAPDASIDSVHVRFLPQEVVIRSGAEEARGAYGSRLEIGGVRFAVRAAAEEDASLRVLPRDVAVTAVVGGLQARPLQGTDVIEITYVARDRPRARQVVNAVAEEYQGYNAQMAQQQSRRRRIFLEDQLRNIDASLADAQLALSTFRRQWQVYSSRDQLSGQQQALMSLDIRREELEAEHRMYQSLLATLLQPNLAEAQQAATIRTLVSSPGVASNPVVSYLYAQLVQHELARDGLLTGPEASTLANPDVVRVNSLITTTTARLIEAVRSHVASLETRVAALDGLRVRNMAEFLSLPDAEAEEARLVQEVASASRMADELRTDLQRALMAEAVEAGRVEIIHLAPDAGRVPLGRGNKVALAMVLGLMLGCGGAFGAESMNTSIRRRQELDSALKIPSLAIIPRVLLGTTKRRNTRLPAVRRSAGSTDHPGNHVVEAAYHDSRSHGAEAYRKLRNSLSFSDPAGSLKTLVVTSALPGEGKTVTAINLAASFARRGERVLLIDCDVRRARIHQVFGISRSPGLAELAAGQCLPVDAVRTTAQENLLVLPNGRFPDNGQELLNEAALKDLLRRFASRFDHIIIDAPPVLATADAVALGSAADGVLFVLRAGETDRGLAERAVRELTLAGARLIGSVLNDPEEQLLDEPYSAYYAYAAASADGESIR